MSSRYIQWIMHQPTWLNMSSSFQLENSIRMAGKKRQNNSKEIAVPRKRQRTRAAIESSTRNGTTDKEEPNVIGEVSSSQASNGIAYFSQLPDEMLAMIASKVPLRYWPSLERVDRRFRQAVVTAWRDLRDGSLDEFFDKQTIKRLGASGCREKLMIILPTLINRSPNIETLSGFHVYIQTMILRYSRQIIQFCDLERVDFSKCYVPPRILAEFLSTTGSRARLKELNLESSLRFSGYLSADTAKEKRQQNDEALMPAFGESTNRPSLKLKKLIYVNNNCLSGSCFESLDVSELETLGVSDSQLLSKHLADLLRRCARLIDLNLTYLKYKPISVAHESNQPVDKDVVLALANLPSERLESLHFDGGGRLFTTITDKEFAQVLSQLGRRCGQMKTLVLGIRVVCSPVVIDAIANNFPNLTRLHLNVQWCASADLVRLVTRLTKLEDLEFETRSTQALSVNASVIEAIATHLSELTTLKLTRSAVTPEQFQLLDGLKKLKKLSISGSYVANKTVMTLCQNFGQQLEWLILEDVPKLSDAAMVVASKKLINVRRLTLTGAGITDISLRAIVSSCPELEELNIAGCTKITASGVQAVIDNSRKLKSLGLVATRIRDDQLVGIDRLIPIR